MSHNQLKAPLTLSAAIAVLLVIAAAPGIFVSGLYHDTASIIATDRGTDLFTLVVVVPVLVVSMLYSRRGSPRAQVVWLGLIAWVAYNYIVYAFGLNFTRVSLVYVAIMSLAIFTLVLVIRRVDSDSLRPQFRPSLLGRVVAAYLWLVGAIFSLLWLSDTIPASLSGTVPARLAALQATSNPVEVNDLAVIIPTLVLAGIWAWQRKPVGYLLAGVMLGLATVTMTALLPGGPIFGSQTMEPVYPLVAVISLIMWVLFLVKAPIVAGAPGQSVAGRQKAAVT